MKKLYWRPSKVSWKIHLVIALLAVGGMATVEVMKTTRRQALHQTKVKAANQMHKAMMVIRSERLARLGSIDAEVDPAQTGLIGNRITPITSLMGYLRAKRTTLNPNWAAVMVDQLRLAGARKGDVVAAGVTGSLPAMNLALYVAAESMGVRLVVITSLESSSYGANLPGFTWLDMEKALVDKQVLKTRSVAASLGGARDRAVGTSPEGKKLLRSTIETQGIRLLEEKTMAANLEQRMGLYRSHAEGRPIVAFVNVGSGLASVGGSEGGHRSFKAGVNRKLKKKAPKTDSIAARFIKQGLPVIYVVGVESLAKKYKLPTSPSTIPTPGTGLVFEKKDYDPVVVVVVLLVLLLALYAFIKIDLGYRIFQAAKRPDAAAKPPEQMV